MPIILNGTTFNNGGTVTFNGQTVKEIKFGTTTVWKAEQTVFSGISVTTDNTGSHSAYDSKTAYSSEYALDFSDFSTLTVTGTGRFAISSQGSYGVENSITLQYKIGSGSWTNLSTLSSGYDNGSVSVSINSSIDISSITGSGYIRLQCWARNSNIGETSSGRSYINDATAVAQ